MARTRILVAEDDALWKLELSTNSPAELVYVDNLADAMSLLDARRRWSGAIFDRYLLEGDIPFSPGRLASEAGFILALAFLEKFPNRRVCVISGNPNMLRLPEILNPLIDSPNFRYLVKSRPNAARTALKFVLEGEYQSENAIAILDYLLLEPNIFGFGLNIRAIIDAIMDHVRKNTGR